MGLQPLLQDAVRLHGHDLGGREGLGLGEWINMSFGVVGLGGPKYMEGSGGHQVSRSQGHPVGEV